MFVRLFVLLIGSLWAFGSLEAQNMKPIVGRDVGYVMYDTTNGRVQVTFSPPALREKDDFTYALAEDVDGVVEKLACMDPNKVRQVLGEAEKSAASWFEALQRQPMCEKKEISRINRSNPFVLTRIPWYEDSLKYKYRTAAQLSQNSWPYAYGGFKGNLNTLISQLNDTIRIKVPNARDTASVVSSVTGRRVGTMDSTFVMYPVRHLIYEYSGLDSAEATEFINKIVTKQCRIKELAPGTVIEKNTGVGAVGRKRVYVPRNGERFMVAECVLNSGRIVYVMESCSNPAFPDVGITYSFSYPLPPTIGGGPPPTPPAAKIPPQYTPPRKRAWCNRGWGPVFCYALPAAIGAGIWFGRDKGTKPYVPTKPEGKPIDRP